MALAVCLGHFDSWTGRHTWPISFTLSVDFFLVLSGFVLAASLYHRREIRLGEFFLSRYLRLAPVYLAAILLTVPLAVWWHDDAGPSLADLVVILGFGQLLIGPVSNITAMEPIAIGWTLSAELWTGLLLMPAAMDLMRKAPAVAVALVSCVAVACLFALVMQSPAFLDVHYKFILPGLRFGLVRCAFDYALGVLAFWVFVQLRSPSAMMASVVQTGCIVLAMAFYAHTGYDRRLDFAAPPLFALLILSLASRTGIVYHLTKGRAGSLLGDISYPLYLIHPLFIFLSVTVFGIADAPWALALYLVASTLVALALNRLVERPCIALFKAKPDKAAPNRPS